MQGIESLKQSGNKEWSNLMREIPISNKFKFYQAAMNQI